MNTFAMVACRLPGRLNDGGSSSRPGVTCVGELASTIGQRCYATEGKLHCYLRFCHELCRLSTIVWAVVETRDENRELRPHKLFFRETVTARVFHDSKNPYRDSGNFEAILQEIAAGFN